MTNQLDIEVADGVCRITFRRPEALNALSEEMARGLVQQLVDAEADDAVRVVVVTGSGSAFSAGADLTGNDPVDGFGEETMDAANLITRSVIGLGKPVVAAVNGIAAGVGASLCFAADLAVAKESAQFLLAFSKVGLMPDGGSSHTVAAAVGRARAMRMALLAEVARRLASGPPLAFAATKRAINAATLGGLEDALEREKRGQMVLFRTADAAEGTRAFVEKRRPTFTGT